MDTSTPVAGSSNSASAGAGLFLSRDPLLQKQPIDYLELVCALIPFSKSLCGKSIPFSLNGRSGTAPRGPIYREKVPKNIPYDKP
jgi:hypothetical protein